MVHSKQIRLPFFGALAVCIALAVANSSYAQVTAPSTFATAIQVQGEELGTEFDDWASSGIPVTDMDPIDNPGGSPDPFIDIANIQVANDDDFLYIRATFHNNSSGSNLFLAFDTDQNSATGFDILEAGLIGSEVGFQNDFPFHQASGTFNTGIALTGGPLGNGGALIFPFFDQDGPEKEWAVPRDAIITFPAPGVPIFPNDSLDFMVYTDEGLGDVSQVISYTFATAPVVVGDYSGNGVVDAADYTVWLDSLGAIGMDLAADGTGDDLSGVPDGDVDQFDYDFWKANFGTGAGIGTGGQAVPEPNAALLFCFAFAGLVLVRR